MHLNIIIPIINFDIFFICLYRFLSSLSLMKGYDYFIIKSVYNRIYFIDWLCRVNFCRVSLFLYVYKEHFISETYASTNSNYMSCPHGRNRGI